ncbi:MAG: hypothetical protein NTV51_13355 [Verrucomicrobia bacterium]|nr:hypothetical protein [Verrucomicrobiota bacterium]
MARAQPKSLEPLSPDRVLDRIAEAISVGLEPAKLRAFPPWTQRVMRILKDQFVPREFASILAADQSIFAEGIAVAMAAKARDLKSVTGGGAGQFAGRLATRLALDPKTQDVAQQVETGGLAISDDYQKHVMGRLFAADVGERRAFVEGLAVGNRLPELFDHQAQRSATDASGIYLTLWLYWPEIAKMNSVGEVAHALEPFFATNKNLAGTHWDERVRKLANRIGLSFRAKQTRRRKK